MKTILDLEQFPLDQPESARYAALVSRCIADLDRDGMFNLEQFVRAEVAKGAADALKPLMAHDAFHHSRRHNVYFKESLDGLAPDHPALQEFETSNRTLCADQLSNSPVVALYQWEPLHRFLAEVIGKERLHPMADPMASVNVMSYGQGDALNWHFDRSEFTTTLLLQAPEDGGVFEYRTDLRTADDPNYEGVARLLRGEDPKARKISVSAGTLNVFRGINTPHRVTPVRGETARMIAVFSYYERPGVGFSAEEQIGFYGRSA